MLRDHIEAIVLEWIKDQVGYKHNLDPIARFVADALSPFNETNFAFTVAELYDKARREKGLTNPE